ncbi:MAG: hypothetical protein JWQ07_1661 [Ramlibacter sp.]|nr:hypothetical protein [Ramlibacter sp.]
MPLPAITITPGQYLGGGEVPPYPIEQFTHRCLAQGDSWFSIGAFPPYLTTNLLFGLKLAASTCIVNCAVPGKVLQHMTDTTTSDTFLQMLNGALQAKFDGILLSGGGNDLIDALQSTDADPAKRLLRLQAEWGPPGTGGARYISDAGWTVFESHLQDVFSRFITARDQGVNQNVPVIFHTYDMAAPRPAGAGFGFGPWLSKALTAFNVPGPDWNDVSTELFDRLHQLLSRLEQIHANVHLVDTLGTLTRAGNSDPGATADWQNEIHPTKAGYKKLSAKWAVMLDAVL